MGDQFPTPTEQAAIFNALTKRFGLGSFGIWGGKAREISNTIMNGLRVARNDPDKFGTNNQASPEGNLPPVRDACSEEVRLRPRPPLSTVTLNHITHPASLAWHVRNVAAEKARGTMKPRELITGEMHTPVDWQKGPMLPGWSKLMNGSTSGVQSAALDSPLQAGMGTHAATAASAPITQAARQAKTVDDLRAELAVAVAEDKKRALWTKREEKAAEKAAASGKSGGGKSKGGTSGGSTSKKRSAEKPPAAADYVSGSRKSGRASQKGQRYD